MRLFLGLTSTRALRTDLADPVNNVQSDRQNSFIKMAAVSFISRNNKSIPCTTFRLDINKDTISLFKAPNWQTGNYTN